MSPVALAILFVLFASLYALFGRKNGRKLPPGPPAYPIIGNLHMLGKLPHQDLSRLAKKYGPVMFMKLGNVPTLVISSPHGAELVVKTHDNVFSSRPKTQAGELLSYGSKAMAFTQYGPYWRSLRKLCNMQLLSTSKIESYAPLRKNELEHTVAVLKNASEAREVVNVTQVVCDLIEDTTYMTIIGRGRNDGYALHLKSAIHEILELAGAVNIADYLPFLKPFDLQGLAKKMKSRNKLVDEVLNKIIDEHERALNNKDKEHKDFVDVLVSLLGHPMNPHDEDADIVTKDHIKAILVDLIGGSFETSATLIEWVITELLRKPEVMVRMQEELKRVVGMDRMVQESDVPKLHYVEMVLKECLRLHPVVPLLIPHASMEDFTLEGYFVPKHSTVLVNLWAIGRDPKVWPDSPEEFIPERFAHDEIDVRGHDFRLIPFGAGRRGCPGMNLGWITVRLGLAQLVHCFNWELPDGVSAKDIDMTERFGLTLPRANPLFAKVTYRLQC